MSRNRAFAATPTARGAFLCALLVGCGPKTNPPVPDDAADRYAAAMCTAHDRCGCLGEGFDSFSDCTTTSRKAFAWVESWPNVKFDLECFEKFVEHLDSEAECGGRLEMPAVPCIVFTGTLSIGETCISEWEGGPQGITSPGGLAENSCADGGECLTGRCSRPPRPVVFDGEACNLSLGVRCGDLYCSRDGICRERKSAGEACDTPASCETALACVGLQVGTDTLGECRDPLVLGEECDPDHVQACAGVAAGNYCSPEERVCAAKWPVICDIAHRPPDAFEKIDWIPL